MNPAVNTTAGFIQPYFAVAAQAASEMAINLTKLREARLRHREVIALPDFSERYNDGKPADETPMVNPFFGQPESTFDLINKYGTYNIQPTNEQENAFPAIMQALPKRWRETEFTKQDLENM